MPGLRDLALRRRYSSGRHDLTSEFFAPCMKASVRYDRAAGFFSSSLYTLIGVPIAEFALRGGRIRLVCSPRLDADDIEAMEKGYEQRVAGTALLRELESQLADLAGRAATEL